MQLGIGTVLGCMLFLLMTNPESLPIVFLLLLPAMIAVSAASFARVLILVFTEVTIDRSKVISAVVGAGVMTFALLGSLHQLGVQDLILLALLTSGSLFYLKRFQGQP